MRPSSLTLGSNSLGYLLQLLLELLGGIVEVGCHLERNEALVLPRYVLIPQPCEELADKEEEQVLTVEWLQ